MPSPDFLIIGAAKSGTTSLLADLHNHPEVYTPGHEINYFTHQFGQGQLWYESIFHCHDKVQGEKSTSYLYETACHRQIFAHNPAMKLIILLREPVKRAFSNWTMRYNQSRLLKQAHLFNGAHQPAIENIGFSHLFDYYMSCPSATTKRQEPLDIFERGLYMEQIESLRSIFPDGQLLILISERYFHHPEETLSRVSRFLNIGDFPENSHAWKRKTEYPVKLDAGTAVEVQRFYKPFNDRFFKFFGEEIEEWRP
jgi:hypothetical protein